jgi:hypothetical protein
MMRPELTPKLIGAVAAQYRNIDGFRGRPSAPVDRRSGGRSSRNPAQDAAVAVGIFNFARAEHTFGLPSRPVIATTKRRDPPAAVLDFFEPEEIDELARGRRIPCRAERPADLEPDEIEWRAREDAQDAELYRIEERSSSDAATSNRRHSSWGPRRSTTGQCCDYPQIGPSLSSIPVGQAEGGSAVGADGRPGSATAGSLSCAVARSSR